MTDTEMDCIEFLRESSVSFEQLIRCFNYWFGLTKEERHELIEDYSNGKFNGSYSW